MTRQLKRAAVVGLALFATTAGLAAAERIDREYHESFQVGPGARLHLDHGDGDVTLRPWDRDLIQIDVVYRAEFGGIRLGGRRDFEVEFDQTGDTVRVIGREPSFTGIGFNRQYEYRYEIQAPAWVELRLEGDDGDVDVGGWRAAIRGDLDDGDVHLHDVEADRVELRLEDGDVVIEGLSGDLKLELEDGDVRVVDCDGRARIDAEDGDVDVRGCAGDLSVHGEDGRVRLTGIEAGSLDVSTEDGDVEIELSAARDLELTASSSDGDITLGCPSAISATVDIRTDDGRIRLDLPHTEIERSRRRVTGRLGDGAGRIRIATDDGNVTLREG